MTSPIRTQLQSMLRTEPRDGGFTATLTVDPNLSILPDHFAEKPILPGLCMVQAVLLAASSTLNAHRSAVLRLRKLKTAKWLMPVYPGHIIDIEGDIQPADGGQFLIRARFTSAGERCADFSLIASEGASS